MIRLLVSFFGWLGAFFRTRHHLGLQLAALRQQVGVLKRKNHRPRLSRFDRLFWVLLRRFWRRWSEVLVIVKPQTVARWHRAGFRRYWRFLSRRAESGRPEITREVRELIQRMAAENPTWGAPRIHGELLKLGFEISERTVSRYLAGVAPRGEAGKQWLSFLKNHREVIAAIDFFTVPTVTFRFLYCFFAIGHNRRRILHLNLTEHPTGQWIVQQLREAFPNESAHRYLILDRDAKFSESVIDAIKTMGTSYQSPWQNGVAERWVASCRQDLLDHVIVLNEAQSR